MEQLTQDEKTAIRDSKDLIDLYREMAAVQSAAIAYIQNGADAQDVESRIFEAKKLFQEMRAFKFQFGGCTPPQVFDPATGTCS